MSRSKSKDVFMKALLQVGILSLLFSVSPSSLYATAQEAGTTSAGVATAAEQPSFMGALVEMLPMLAVCYLIFYFMVIRPQERKTKQHKALLESMKKGDSVVTSSGMVGRVAVVESDHVLLEIAPSVKVKFLRQHIVGLENQPSTSKAA